MAEPASAPLIAPADEHNARLVANVHPANWVDPEPAGRYHLVVVGAGTAGLVSAAGAAGLGARVALVERHLMGGDCLNVGCVPSKAVLRAARAWHDAHQAAARFGGPPVAEAAGPAGSGGSRGGGDFAAAMERMRRLRADLSPVDGAARFRGLGVDVFFGDGRFVAPDAVEVNGRRLRFRRAVIATGARAAALPVPGLAEAGYLTNETVFGLTALPRRLAVVGAGPIGCELAQAFARFGAEVTLLDVADRILLKEDLDAAAVVRRALEADGVRLELGVKIVRVSRGGGAGDAKILHLERDPGAAPTAPASTSVAGTASGRMGSVSQVAADEILVAVGRAPNVEGLGLEAAGVAYTKKGVTVDDRLRTSNGRIYAAGDVASPFQFTHAADAMARIVIQNALFFGRKKVSDLVMPWVTYTSPEVAHVGLYEADARASGRRGRHPHPAARRGRPRRPRRRDRGVPPRPSEEGHRQAPRRHPGRRARRRPPRRAVPRHHRRRRPRHPRRRHPPLPHPGRGGEKGRRRLAARQADANGEEDIRLVVSAVSIDTRRSAGRPLIHQAPAGSCVEDSQLRWAGFSEPTSGQRRHCSKHCLRGIVERW